ncbi:hypothetical protein [Ramlibacter alkalitolerans]|uniref:DUF1311 domain-containing protein n=1 Tax=Ramlibacter alkalitolerans TaxID=2039631 RepID=A0ABS1JTA1_9BURK|nr:hypothetical protein [Ramlibacter alkalitolerans]MBL0427452.1 hypothetical protein [Ramlibacter alkalitolerans]
MLRKTEWRRSGTRLSSIRWGVVAGLSAMLVMLATDAGAAASSVSEYRNATRRALAECGKADAGEARTRELVVKERRACIRRAQKEAGEKFSSALQSVENPSGKSALFRYREVFNEAIAGAQRLGQEPTAAYEQRQMSSRHALCHAWSKFELAD